MSFQGPEFEKVKNNFDKIKGNLTDQYILSDFLTSLSKEENKPPKVSSGNSIIRIAGIDPFSLTNVITRSGDSLGHRNVFNTFNNAQLSFLTPEIKLVLRKTIKGKRKYFPIPFQNIQSEFKIYESAEKSNALLGLKNINISLRGEAPETARNDIDASLTFYGNTLAVFNENPNYQNLIIPSILNEAGDIETELLLMVGWAMPIESHESEMNFLEYTKEQISALNTQFQVFIMGYVDHSFSFNQDGSFILETNYVSRIDETLITSYYSGDEETIKNVYGHKPAPKPEVRPSQYDLKAVDTYIKTNHESATPEAKENIKNRLLQGHVYNNIRRFEVKLAAFSEKKFKQLFKDIKYKYFEMPHTQLNLNLLIKSAERENATMSSSQLTTFVDHLVKSGTFNENMFYSTDQLSEAEDQLEKDVAATTGQTESPIDPESLAIYSTPELAEQSALYREEMATTAAVRETLKAAAPAIKIKRQKPNFLNKEQFMEKVEDGTFAFEGNYYIPYTNIGTICAAYLKSISQQLKKRDLKVALGTVKISVPGIYENGRIFPIYDIPVAEQTLKEVTRKIYTSRVTSKVTFMNFIEGLLNEVLKKYYLQGDYIFDSGKYVAGNVIRTTQYTCVKSTVDKIVKQPSSIRNGVRNGIRTLGDVTNEPKFTSLFVVYAGPADDEDNSIRLDNYQVGAVNSIIKKVNYTQSNIAVMAERRAQNVVNAYRNQKLSILPQLYNVKMDIVGNLNFLPGYLFNLWPNAFGVSGYTKDNVLKKLGLQGSYMTLGVEHSIGEGGFTTTIDAYNVTTETYIDKAIKEREQIDKKKDKVVTKVND